MMMCSLELLRNFLDESFYELLCPVAKMLVGMMG